jgi:hypothetical protein
MICTLGQSLPELQALKVAVDRMTAALRQADGPQG